MRGSEFLGPRCCRGCEMRFDPDFARLPGKGGLWKEMGDREVEGSVRLHRLIVSGFSTLQPSNHPMTPDTSVTGGLLSITLHICRSIVRASALDPSQFRLRTNLRFARHQAIFRPSICSFSLTNHYLFPEQSAPLTEEKLLAQAVNNYRAQHPDAAHLITAAHLADVMDRLIQSCIHHISSNAERQVFYPVTVEHIARVRIAVFSNSL